MEGLILEAGYLDSKKPYFKIKLKESGYLGSKHGLFYFSANLMFFQEKELVAKIFFDEHNNFQVTPVSELEMHFFKRSNPKLAQKNSIKMKIGKQDANLEIGNDLYVNGHRLSLFMLKRLNSVLLSKVDTRIFIYIYTKLNFKCPIYIN